MCEGVSFVSELLLCFRVRESELYYSRNVCGVIVY